MGKKIVNGFYYFSYILFGFFVTAMLLFGLKVWGDAEFLFATQKSIVLVAIVAAGAFFLGAFFLKLSKKLKQINEKKLWIAIGIISILMVIAQIVVLNLLEISYLWDGVNVFSSAVSRLKRDGVVELYFSRYANQNGFLAVTYSLLKLGCIFGLAEANYMLYLNIWNMIFMDIAIGLAAAILYKIRKEKKVAAVLLFLILTAMNPFIYLWTAFYYTSILVMPVFLGIVYLVLCMEQQKTQKQETQKQETQEPVTQKQETQKQETQKPETQVSRQIKLAQTILLAVLLVVGMRLRQTTVILAIALILAKLVEVGLRAKKNADLPNGKGNLIQTIGYIAVFGLCLLLTNAACKSYETKLNNLDTTDTAFPAVHWIMMGLDHGGEYNNSDADYTASFPTHEEKVQGDMELLVARLKHFGVKGIAKTYSRKFINTWVSASNAYPFRLSVCQKYTGVHDLVFGNKNDFVIYYHQIYQVLLLFFIFAGIRKKWKEKKPDSIYVLHLSFLGTILFHLLWEAGPLYSVSLQIVYFLLAAYGILCVEPSMENDQSPLRANKITWKTKVKAVFAGNRKYIVNALFFIGMAITVLFFIMNFNTFTNTSNEREKRVVNQYLASDNLKIQVGEQVSQTFLATRDFNYFNIHLCNHENEKNTSVYQLTLTGEKHGVVYEETIYAKDILLDSFLMRQFDTISIEEPEQFTLTLKALESEGDNYLEVIYFSMKDYDPYTKGIFTKNEEQLKGDMFLMVSEKTNGAYATRKQYVFTVLFILMAELAIWIYYQGKQVPLLLRKGNLHAGKDCDWSGDEQ